MTHICVGKLNIIGSGNGLSPGRHQAIILTITGILLIGPPETNFNEFIIEINALLFTKIRLKYWAGKWWPFCIGIGRKCTQSHAHADTHGEFLIKSIVKCGMELFIHSQTVRS